MSFVEELVNSFDVDADEPDPESLREPADVEALLAKWNLLRNGETCTEADLTEVRALRGGLRAVFEERDESDAATKLNALLAGAPVTSTLHQHGGDGWRLDLRASTDLPLSRRVAVEAALGLADAIETYGFDRLSVCEADPCRDVFLDISRNGSRRYCDQKCGNRHNVAAFRQRQRG